jgi:GNAT superfamily N-acetyltransferase
MMYELMETSVADATKEAVREHGVESLAVDDLTHTDLDKISWSGGPLHPKYVEEALNRVPGGEVEYLAVRAPSGWPVAIGGIDYAAEEGAGTLWQLATHPRLRGLGLGTRLITEAEKRIQDRGLEWARLSVEDDNGRARALYERLGYEKYGDGQESWNQVDETGNVYTHHADVALMNKRLP